MEMLAIRGGVPLRGRVTVGGAKNAALPLMAAAILCDETLRLRQVPDLVDVQTLRALLVSLGLSVEAIPSRYVSRGDANGPSIDDGLTLDLRVVDPSRCVADYELVRRMRASICVLGPLLARRGEACVSLPGGCAIGDRPVDLHLKGLTALGAEIRVERGYIHARAKRLRGASIYLGGPFGSTVTGTCNVMTAATLAEGRTTIESAACEPEVVDLGRCLIALGAKIDGLGTPFMTIDGVDRLTGCDYTVIPDRIEAVTLMIAAAITRGDVVIDRVRLDHITAVLEKLREIGVRIEPVPAEGTGAGAVPGSHEHVGGSRQEQLPVSIRVTAPGEFRPTDCVMLPYPGLPTDVQAQLMTLLALAPGLSLVTDKVFPDRFLHAAELTRMGAIIRREGPTAILCGVNRLSGASVMASDLRASAALVLAALAAEGDSVIRRIYHLDRGYVRLDAKLQSLGAQVQRVEDQPEQIPASLSADRIASDLLVQSLAARQLSAEKDVAEAETDPHALRGPNWSRIRAPRSRRGPQS